MGAPSVAMAGVVPSKLVAASPERVRMARRLFMVVSPCVFVVKKAGD
jgi:hypothetical protein